MSTAIVTGSAGLVGSQAVRHFHERGWDVIGIDNDMRSVFFGVEASTRWMSERLTRELDRYRHVDLDIRDTNGIERAVREAGEHLELVVHTAAQPSHDWAARDPLTDFSINAQGTLTLLETVRKRRSDATFIFLSTNKVYGDTPNHLPLIEYETRFDLPPDHPLFVGVPESMSIDHSTHSLFGVSKAAADLLVQEYGRYFEMRTVSLRGGCLTGPGHSGAELHGFLAYLMKCTVTETPYTIYGYKGKQVRDNIHSADLVAALDEIVADPKPGSVYNIGGGREANCSLLEAIEACERLAGKELTWSYVDQNRTGDHIWWISDLTAFRRDYPRWTPRYDIEAILTDILESNAERWLAMV